MYGLVLGRYREQLDVLAENGAQLIRLLKRSDYQNELERNIGRHVPAQFVIVSDKEYDKLDSLKEIASAVSEQLDLQFVITFNDSCQLKACRLSQFLELNYLYTEASIERSFSKQKMRVALGTSAINIDWCMAQDKAELSTFFDHCSTGIVVKPVSGEGSKDVGIVHSREELGAFKVSFPALCEAYVQGQEYSIEAISIGGHHEVVAIAKKQLNPGTMIAEAHIAPAPISDAVIEGITSAMVEALDALGFVNGVSHTEILVDKQGAQDQVKIIESHTRVGGALMTDLVSCTYGVDLIELNALQVLGMDIAPHLHRYKRQKPVVSVLCYKFYHYNDPVLFKDFNLDPFSDFSLTRTKEFVPRGKAIKDVNSVVDRLIGVVAPVHQYKEVDNLLCTMRDAPITTVPDKNNSDIPKVKTVTATRELSNSDPVCQQNIAILGTMRPIHHALKSLGFNLTLIMDRSSMTPAYCCAIYDRVIIVERQDDQLLEDLVEGLHRQKPFASMVCYTDKWQKKALSISKRLDLEYYLNESAVKQSISKHLMRTAIPDKYNPHFQLIDNQEQLYQTVSAVDYDVIVKPISASASRGVTRIPADCEDPASLYGNNEGVYPALLESCILGKEYSVEAFSHKEQHKILCVTEKMVDKANFVETGHRLPAVLDTPDVEEAVSEAVKEVLDSIGHTNGFSHTEVFIHNKDIKVVETHTRLGGDRIPEMLHSVSGMDLFYYWALISVRHIVPAVDSELSEFVANFKTDGFACIMFALPKAQGLSFAGIANKLALLDMPGVINVYDIMPKGHRPEQVHHSFDRTMAIQVKTPCYDKVIQLCETALNQTELLYQYQLS
ncbi:hypothetical protein VHA01S_073_00100 [Vibrio halioticoli NBRC 102217]|uniref:ATP-grasp domain-containing protein n=1 Tax=Vibrio halioticoli NBRC 102217 TaxID=1219072 RepID=V5FHI3_9VIBR|nr:ATP-grasp domain-containing protein [Vibrio halioticoli]GAD91198.1 hypothetical protein VHA01S_073_00100 [Vibrio halioticoli NBRC 102217]